MLAARWHGRGDIRVEQIPEPAAGPGEAFIRVEWCGMCGTDLHEYRHGPILIPSRPHPLTGKVPPVTLGHEFCGTVVAAGDGCPFGPGERVTASACLVCRECSWCQQGATNLCAKLGSIGLCADGAFAEFVAAPAYTLYRVPPELDSESAALTEPTAVAVHACRRGRVRPGDTVAVVGAGTIGLLVQQVALALGTSRVFAIEPVPLRRQLARQLGAVAALDPAAEPPDRTIAAATENRRADVAFECTGTVQGVETAVRVSGKGSRVVLVGIYAEGSVAPWGRFQAHEKEILGASAYTEEFPEALQLLASGKVRAAPLITARFPLAEFAAALQAVSEHPAAHVKILIRP